MGKAILREFLLFILALVLAIPSGLLFLGFILLANESTSEEELVIMYTVGYFLSIFAIYIFRIIASLLYRFFAAPIEAEA